jgi:uncharacterized membrane protein YeaQ/YmgE (transglycosylase-associated protein family)
MDLLWVLLFGLVVGVLAKLFVPGRDPGGLLVTSALGIAGAVIANVIGQVSGLYRSNEAPGLLASVLGAMLLLFIHKRLSR